MAIPRSNRLPPGQHWTKDKFPVLDLGIHPEIAPEDWSLEIGGLVENPLTLSWEAFHELPQSEDISDFHCVTTWSVSEARWGGVRFSEILDRVKPTSEARFAFYTCFDGYTTNTALEPLRDDGVFLANRLNGEPLPAKHGGPVRVVIPKLYAWKSAKFIKQIEFRDEDEPGYWEKRGYSDSADPWKEERHRGD